MALLVVRQTLNFINYDNYYNYILNMEYIYSCILSPRSVNSSIWNPLLCKIVDMPLKSRKISNIEYYTNDYGYGVFCNVHKI